MRVFYLTVISLAALPFGAMAQLCNGNIDLAGPYEFTVSRLVWSPVPFAPPGTTAAVTLAPNEEAAQRAGTQGSFAVAGRLIADGNGSLFSGTDVAGTYSVTSGCAVTLQLSGPGQPGRRGSAAFAGFLWGRGEEAVLLQTGTEQQGSPAQLRMSRPFLFTGCSNATFSGLYGLAVEGIQGGADSSQPVTPFSLVGQMLADGNGAFASGASLLGGSYSVRSDCTGTATIRRGSDSWSMDFVLVQDRGVSNRPAMLVTLRGLRISGDGIAR